MSLRAIATTLFGFIVTAIISALISANVKKLADKHGWDNFLVRTTEKFRWERLREVWWLWSISGLSGGVVLALWLTPLIVGPTQSKDEIARQVALQSELNTPKQQQTKTETPSTTVAPSENYLLENLRKSDGVSPISPVQNHLPIQRIPNGRFGYVYGIDVQLCIMSHGQIRVNSENYNNTDFEIHKSSNGKIFVIGFIAEQDALSFQDPTHHTVNYTIFSYSYESNSSPVKIPLTDIKEWEWRSVPRPSSSGQFASIAEIRLKGQGP